MKKRILSISLLSLVLILSSCQKIKDIFSVKVDADLTVSLPITIGTSPLKSTTGVFSSTKILDPLNDEDLADYKDKIKSFDVTNMTGTVSELSADVTLTNCTLLVETDANSTQWTFTNLPLTNGTMVTFDNTSDQWTKINEILDEQKPVTVTFSGTSTQSNVTFNLLVKFTTEVSVKVL